VGKRGLPDGVVVHIHHARTNTEKRKRYTV
jgi:hypothetical protein